MSNLVFLRLQLVRADNCETHTYDQRNERDCKGYVGQWCAEPTKAFRVLKQQRASEEGWRRYAAQPQEGIERTVNSQLLCSILGAFEG